MKTSTTKLVYRFSEGDGRVGLQGGDLCRPGNSADHQGFAVPLKPHVHNEPVFSTRTGLRSRLAEVQALLSQVVATVAPFVAKASQVDRLLNACPVSGLV